MDDTTLTAFRDELSKIAGLGNLWQRVLDTFRPEEEAKVRRRVEYHFSPKAGPEKWDKLVRRARDQKFVDAISQHPDSDEKLVQHAKSMHELSRGKTLGKIQSERLPGRTYEVRETPSGLACTCPDWRYRKSVSSDAECKHIKAHNMGSLRPNQDGI